MDTDEENMTLGRTTLLAELDAAIQDFQKDTHAIEYFDKVPEYVIER